MFIHFPVGGVQWASKFMQTTVHIQSLKTSSRLGISSSQVVVITSRKLNISLRSMYCSAGVYSGVRCSWSKLYGQGQGHRLCGCECSWMHKCLSGTGLSIQKSSSNGAVGKSSSSSSSQVTSRKGPLVRCQTTCSTGEDCSVLPWSGLVSVDELSLNDKQWNMELRLLCWWGECVWYVHDVAGQKDKFSPVDMLLQR